MRGKNSDQPKLYLWHWNQNPQQNGMSFLVRISLLKWKWTKLIMSELLFQKLFINNYGISIDTDKPKSFMVIDVSTQGGGRFLKQASTSCSECTLKVKPIYHPWPCLLSHSWGNWAQRGEGAWPRWPSGLVAQDPSIAALFWAHGSPQQIVVRPHRLGAQVTPEWCSKKAWEWPSWGPSQSTWVLCAEQVDTLLVLMEEPKATRRFSGLSTWPHGREDLGMEDSEVQLWVDSMSGQSGPLATEVQRSAGEAWRDG